MNSYTSLIIFRIRFERYFGDLSEVYSEPCQTSEMVYFATIANDVIR